MKAVSKTRRLKVFMASFGFHESIVAAPNQGAALKAWGVNQNLFAEGQARVTTDERATTAALAHPETPLRRAVGSNDPFELQPTGSPRIPIPPPSTSAKGARSKPAADRAKLDAAEKALQNLDDERQRQAVEFTRRREALDTEEQAARRAYAEARRAAQHELETASAAYAKAGGEDRSRRS